VQHLELSRVIARPLERAVRARRGILSGAQAAALSPTPRIMGLDGQAKMSKSMGNTIGLLETPEQIWDKLRPAVTDPKRVKRTDPGTPEVCNIFSSAQIIQSGGNGRGTSPFSAARPDGDASTANACCTRTWCRELTPIQARAKELREKPKLVDDALARGTAHCREIAKKTIGEVRERMGID